MWERTASRGGNCRVIAVLNLERVYMSKLLTFPSHWHFKVFVGKTPPSSPNNLYSILPGLLTVESANRQRDEIDCARRARIRCQRYSSVVSGGTDDGKKVNTWSKRGFRRRAEFLRRVLRVRLCGTIRVQATDTLEHWGGMRRLTGARLTPLRRDTIEIARRIISRATVFSR